MAHLFVKSKIPHSGNVDYLPQFHPIVLADPATAVQEQPTLHRLNRVCFADFPSLSTSFSWCFYYTIILVSTQFNADEFFLRPYKEYGKWLVDNTREQLDFIVTDLIRMSKDQIVICDLHLTLDEAMLITDPEHIVFLIKKPKNIINDYCNRPDHDDFKQFINSASNPSLAKENCGKTLEFINNEKYESIKKSSYFWVERDNNSTVEKTLFLVENHFGFKHTI